MKLFNNHSGFKRSPLLYKGNLLGDRFISEAPSRRGARELIRKPRPLAVIRNRRLNSVAL